MASTNQWRRHFICLASLLVLGVWASQASCRSHPEQSMLERHEKWMANYGRVYKDADEKEKRYKIFKENVERIEAFNQGTNRTYKLGVNKFTDLTNEEFQVSYTGFKPQTMPTSKSPFFKYANVTADVPPTVDWRDKAVTQVKDQGRCG